MKTRLFKSTVSLLLALLLCLSLVTPAVLAAEENDPELAETADDGELILEKHADSAKVTRNNLIGLFNGGSGSSVYYGIASPDDPETITNVTSSSSANVTAGAYIAYMTTAYTGSILSRKADWTNLEKRSSLNFTVRLYYNATFTVTGCNDGELYLNNEPVDGEVRLFPDETYTVTAKEVEGYPCNVTGVTLGEEFSPEADLTVVAAYVADASAAFSVTANEGGTVQVLSGGMEVTDIIPAGESFEVVAIPNTNRGYALESIVVTKDGDEVEEVDGFYGPVADDEVYEITVTFTFDPPVVEKEADANNPRVSRTELSNFLGSYSHYGIAPASDPDDITTLTSLLKPNYDVEVGDYYIYATNEGTGSLITSPVWTNAKLMIMTVRTYYTATFTVTGNDDGEIYLNGEAVTGSARLFTDETYTVTAKEIEQYICTVYGVEAGEEFTPTENLDITAAYMNNAFATLTVNANEGGTVEITSDGATVYDKVEEGKTFAVSVKAKSSDAYYVDSVTVTKDGEVVEPVDGVYGPVADKESYEINVVFAQVVLDAEDCNVNLIDIKNKNFDAVEQSIIASTSLTPEAFAEEAVMTVEYAAYSLLGVDIYEPLSYTGLLAHTFGTSSLGGDLAEDNTEKIRITCEIPSLGIKLQDYAVATVKDMRLPTRVEGQDLTITYGDDLRAAVAEVVAVYNENDEPVEFTVDDITVDPTSLNVSLLSRQDVTVTYGGSDIYAISHGTVSVYVRQAKGSLDTKSEVITYGETPAAEVRTVPENLDYIRVIAGVDGEAQGYVSIDIPESVKDKMRIEVAGIVLFDMYDFLSSRIGEGVTLSELREIITSIYDTVNESELIRSALEATGFNMETLDTIMSFIGELPDFSANLKIRLGRTPKNAGVYLMFAVSTDLNYTLSCDVSYLIIRQKSDDDDTDVELRFKEEIDASTKALPYDEAQVFDFGSDVYVDGNPAGASQLHELFIGISSEGGIKIDNEPVRDRGRYVEVAFEIGGNYRVKPIIRSYRISNSNFPMHMENLTVDYDGEAHAVTAVIEEGVEPTAPVTYIYSNDDYYSSEAPVNAGEYTVYATYDGDEEYGETTVEAKLTINKLPAEITVTCNAEVTYGDISADDLSAANIQYEVSGTINEDILGTITPAIAENENFPNVGEYTATVAIDQANGNYDVTVNVAALTIVPREITIAVDDVSKRVGEDDPAFTCTVTDAAGEEVDPEILGLTFDREKGDEIGEYSVYVVSISNANYVIDADASTDGTLTILPPIVRYIRGDVDSDGTVDSVDATWIQRYIAEYSLAIEMDMLAADVDGDGEINVIDATFIQRYLAESGNKFGVGETVEV